jgi:hypothetical protein
MTYTQSSPSPRYVALMEQYKSMHRDGDQLNNLKPEQTFQGISIAPHVGAIKMMIDRSKSRTLLDYGCGKAEGYEKMSLRAPDGREIRGLKAIWGIDEIKLYDPCYLPYSARPEGQYDTVISTDVLEHCPEEDMDWIVSDIFGFSRKAVFCSVALYPAHKQLPTGDNAHVTLKSAGWWLDLFERTKRAHGGRKYFLAICRNSKDFLFVEG